jgi:PAS domain S-box-containing protein
VHPDDRWLARWVCERALTSGEAFAFDHRVLLADGTVRHLHGRGSVTAGGDGRPARLVGSAQDVSERKEAERALQEREERFRRLIENSSDQVMIVDTAGAVTYVGPSVERMLGYTPDEFLGIRPIDIVHPDDVPLVMEAIAHHVAHPGDTTTIQYRIRHKDGSWRVFENLGRTVSPHSADEGLVANCRDVTERASAEAALARAKEEAERANRAKSEFLSRMSHELRTPMNSILGFAQLLARAELPAPQGKSVGHILKAGRHLLRLINEVLEIARIEAGRENFSLEPVAVAPVLREAFGLVRPLAQQHGVALHEAAWPEGAFVHADRQRLVQVLLNLLSNAIKYNRPGGHVGLACAAARAGAGRCGSATAGAASRPERADQLFTPFARLGAEQTDVEGTGLGLPCRSGCARPWAAPSRSRPRAGGQRLPRRARRPPRTRSGRSRTRHLPALAAPAPRGDAAVRRGQPGEPEPRRDDPAGAPRLAHAARAPGAARRGAGARAPARPRAARPAPARHPGLEVLRRLRADPRTAAIPVVVVSADATAASFDRLRAAGADAYLTKPLDVDEFLVTVERFLRPAPRPAAGDVAAAGEGA